LIVDEVYFYLSPCFPGFALIGGRDIILAILY
jgi:hypothetical protein